jgi:ribonuclease VapC
MVVDSSALVAIVTGEPAAARLNAAVAEAEAVGVPAPCLLETSMVLASRLGEAGLALLDHFLARSGAQVLPFTEAHARAAAKALLRYGKGRHPAGLNFGDCMAYAVAKAEGARLMFTGDDTSPGPTWRGGTGEIGARTHPTQWLNKVREISKCR